MKKCGGKRSMTCFHFALPWVTSAKALAFAFLMHNIPTTKSSLNLEFLRCPKLIHSYMLAKITCGNTSLKTLKHEWIHTFSVETLLHKAMWSNGLKLTVMAGNAWLTVDSHAQLNAEDLELNTLLFHSEDYIIFILLTGYFLCVLCSRWESRNSMM